MKRGRATGLKRMTKRLILRPMQMRDDRAWYAAHCAMLPTKGPWEEPRLPMDKLNFGEYRKYLASKAEQISTGRSYFLGVFHKETGCLLGYVSLTPGSENGPTVLDFRIFNIHWGKGFAKEAVTETMKLASHLKLEPVQIAAKSKGKLEL